MRSPVWTLAEIHALRDTGNWLFGLVRDDRGLHIAEIFPGMGYARVWPRLTDWPMVIADIWRSCR